MAWFWRLLSYACFGLALIAAGGDALRSLEEGQFAFRSLGDAWANLDDNSLNFFQRIVQDYAPSIFDPAVLTLLRLPSWVVLGLFAILFWLLARLFTSRRPRRRFY